MAQVEGFKVEPEDIIVMPHAVQQARIRIPECRQQPDTYIKGEVTRRVREGARISVFDQKPEQFRAKGSRRKKMLPGQRIVVYDDIAFVVDVGMPPKLSVVTVLTELEDW